MKMKISYKAPILFMIMLLFVITDGYAQSKDKKISVRGKVTDFNNKPIEAVQIFVDFVNTDEVTNKRGSYKLKLDQDTKLITVYSPELGYINWQYSGERKVDFVFPEFSEPISPKDFEKLGYTLESPENKEKNWYGEYSTVLEILDKRFSQVRVNNGQIIVGRGGPNVVSGDQAPLILLDNIPIPVSSLSSISTTDIATIRVIHKGSELSQYGFRGVNGVIHIGLKNGGEKG